MNIRKKIVLCTVPLVFSLSLNISQAAYLEWNDLSSIQKDVLQSHKFKWNDYSEAKQTTLLKQSGRIINGLNSYKSWFNNKLTAEERRLFYKNKKEMSATEFQKFVDTLIKKYGKPS